MTWPEAKDNQNETNESYENNFEGISRDIDEISKDSSAQKQLNDSLNNNSSIQNTMAQKWEGEKEGEGEKEEGKKEGEEVEEKKVEETSEKASVEGNTAETEDVAKEDEETPVSTDGKNENWDDENESQGTVEDEKESDENEKNETEDIKAEEPKNKEAQTEEEKTPVEWDVLIPTLPKNIPDWFPPKNLEKTRNKLKENSEQLKNIIELPKKIETKEWNIKEIDTTIAHLNKQLRNTTDKTELKKIKKDIEEQTKEKESLQSEIRELEQQKIDPERIIEKIEQNIIELKENYSKSEAEKMSEEITDYIDGTLGTYLKNINEYKENLKKQETVVSQKESAQTKPSQWKNNPKLTLDLFKNIGEIFKSINLVKGDFFWNIGRIWDAFTGETLTQRLKKNDNIDGDKKEEILSIISNLATKKRPDNNEPKLVNEIIKTIESWNTDDIKKLQMKLWTPSNNINITWKIDINTAKALETYIGYYATTEKLNVSIENMDYSCVDWFTEKKDFYFNGNTNDFWYKMYEKTRSNWRTSYLLVWYKGWKDFIASDIKLNETSEYPYENITVQWSDWTKEEWTFNENLELQNWTRFDSNYPEGQEIKDGKVKENSKWNGSTEATSSGTTQESTT